MTDAIRSYVSYLLAFIKGKPRRSFLLLLLAIFVSHTAWWHLQPKHPDDLFFRISSFRLHNYSPGSDEYREVLRQLLPIGLHRSDVEALLIQAAGLRISSEHQEPSHVVYYDAFGLEKKRLNGITLCLVLDYFCRHYWIKVTYDKDSRVVQVKDKEFEIYK